MSIAGRVKNHLESPNDSEVLQFNQATGKIEVESRHAAQQQQSRSTGVDQRVAVDMNKQDCGEHNGGEVLQYNPATGKLEVVSRHAAQQ